MSVNLTGRLRAARALLLAVLIGWLAHAALALAGSATYVYDELGRLKSVTYDDGTGTAYTLDPAGNRLSVANTDAIAPGQPGALTFSAIAGTTATASWGASTDNIGVAGYDYRLNGGTWVSLGNVLTVNLTGLTSGIAYTFDVRSRDAAGNVSALRTGTFTTLDTVVPGQPGALTFSLITATTAKATWGAATDNVGVVGYDYRLNSGTWTSLGNVLTVNLTGLTTVTTYTFSVRARDAAGNVSATLRTGTFTTLDNVAPGQPGALTFSLVTATTAKAAWGAATDNVGVVGYDYRLNGGIWTSLGNVLTVNLTALVSGTPYTFDVRARDAAGNVSATLRTGTFTTLDNVAPTQPGALTFTNIAVTTATANWVASTDNVAVVGYDYRLNGGTWTSLGNVLTVNLTGLTAVTGYTVDLRARDAAGNLSVLRTNTFTTLSMADTTPPSQPGTLTFSAITATTATATWGAATDNVAVVGYDYRLNAGTWTSLGNVLTVNLSSLTSGTAYTFDVRARDGAGNVSATLRTGTFNTVDTVAPSQPGALSFTSIAATTATASWGAATDNVAVVGYDYRLNGGSWNSLGNVLTVNLSALTGGTAYTFDVRARDAAGNVSATLRTGSFTTVDNVLPSQPGAVSFSSILDTSATASWGAATDNVGVVGYDYRVNGGAWNALGNVLSVGLTGLSAGTLYAVDVRARDAAGNVSATPSSGSFSTTDSTPPTQPGLPSFSSITASTATASWGAATDNVGVVGYDYRLNGGTWVSLANVLSVGLSGLAGATTYTFDVRARDAAGHTSSPASANFTTANPITSTFTSGYTFSTTSGGLSTTEAQYALLPDGTIGVFPNDCPLNCGFGGAGPWLSPSVGMANYEAMATNQSCFDTEGTFGVWSSLDLGHSWGVFLGTINQSINCTMTVQIRAKANPGVILGTATIAFNLFTGT